MTQRATTFDVRIWGIEPRKGKRGTTYAVRWIVAKHRFRRVFATAKLADGFRAELLTSIRQGRAFDVENGMPEVLAHERRTVTWFEHATTYAAEKWPTVSAAHRRGIAETLTDLTIDLTPSYGSHEVGTLRHVLKTIAFTQREPTPADRKVLEWLSKHSTPIADVGKPVAARRLLDRLSRTIDGLPAAASTFARKRAVLHNCLDAAVEAEHLTTNPLSQIKRWRPVTSVRLNPGAVAGPELAALLLTAVRDDRPELEAYFACLYYGGLRPGEARGLRRPDLVLPESGWGEILLGGSQQAVARLWTDNDSTRQDRPLKHRQPGEIRPVSAPPELVATLRRHLDEFECGIDGHLFVARTGRGGHPLPRPYQVTVGENTLARAWDRARAAVMTPEQYASPLARRPYDLRHAAHSTWLAAGVSPADVAARAGHSVNMLMKVYAHPIDGREQRNRAAVEVALQRAALQLPAGTQNPAPPPRPGSDPAATSR